MIAVLIGVFLLLKTSTSEPTYAGKTLREWLELNIRNNRGEVPEAVENIRHIGTNAIPFLIRWMQHYREIPPWRENIYDGLERLSGSGIVWKFARVLEADTFNGLLACEGLRILGPEAKSAIPELTRLANDASPPEIAARATMALGNIGEQATPSLLAILVHTNVFTRIEALYGLGRIGTNAHIAVPTVLSLLTNSASDIRTAATNCLKKIAPRASPR